MLATATSTGFRPVKKKEVKIWQMTNREIKVVRDVRQVVQPVAVKAPRAAAKASLARVAQAVT
jgi:hypothetical protein